MSIALMTMARKTALQTNLKFALMALADWADDNGASCWPSVYELSEYMTCSERTVQRLLRDLEVLGWIAVVGYANGGASSRRYCLNVPRMVAEAQAQSERRESDKESRRRDRNADPFNPFANGCQPVTPSAPVVTPDKLTPVTNEAKAATSTTRGVTTATRGVTPKVSRGDAGVTPTTIDPPEEPPLEPPHNHHVHPAVPAATAKPKGAPVEQNTETALQAACRETWRAYVDAYTLRYGAAPVRNAQVNAKVKQFVQLIGFDESPAVARFYVERVNEAFVVRQVHDLGLLVKGSAGYRTQWATNTTMTNTRARQADQSQANCDVADEAMAILRAQREQRGNGAADAR